MKKTIALVLSLVMCLCLFAACGNSNEANTPADTSKPVDTSKPADTSAPADSSGIEGDEDGDGYVDTPTYEWQMPSTEASGRPISKAMQRFADAVYEATKGDVKIEVCPDGLLGDYTTNFEEIMLGTLAIQANTMSTDYDPRLVMTRIPYIASSYDDMENTKEGSWYYDQLNIVLNDLGAELISNWPSGFQGIGGTSVGDVSTLFDPSVKQDAICRVPSITSTLATAEAYGFTTVTIAYSDLYSALQTGMCDCFMGCTDIDTALNFGDVATYFVYANYILQTQPVVMNKEIFDSLPEDYQRIIKDCAEAEFDTICDELEQYSADVAGQMADLGIETYTPSEEELNGFVDHVYKNVWPSIEEMLGTEFYEGLMEAFDVQI